MASEVDFIPCSEYGADCYAEDYYFDFRNPKRSGPFVSERWPPETCKCVCGCRARWCSACHIGWQHEWCMNCEVSCAKLREREGCDWCGKPTAAEKLTGCRMCDNRLCAMEFCRVDGNGFCPECRAIE